MADFPNSTPAPESHRCQRGEGLGAVSRALITSAAGGVLIYSFRKTSLISARVPSAIAKRIV
jgi:hypothetical protein